MMIELDASAKERWDALPVGGTGLHVVEGVHRRPPTLSMELAGEAPCDRCASEAGPPPELVALSKQKCETCDFTIWRKCQGCLGSGRPLVQVTVPCPHDCERFGGRVPGHARGSNWDWVPCWCEGTFRVSIGSVTVEGPPVPIVDDRGPAAVYPHRHATIRVLTALGEAWLVEPLDPRGWKQTRIDLGPNPEQYVGTHWAIVYRVVEKL